MLGENFVVLGPRDEIKLVSFAATRFVEAVNPDEAKIKSVDLIRTDKQWEDEIVRQNLSHANILLDKITEIDAIPKSGSGQGYTFFRQKKLKEKTDEQC